MLTVNVRMRVHGRPTYLANFRSPIAEGGLYVRPLLLLSKMTALNSQKDDCNVRLLPIKWLKRQASEEVFPYTQLSKAS